MDRRSFIKLSAIATGSLLFPTQAARAAANRQNLTPVDIIESVASNIKRHWLGSSFWGNRLQDWRVNDGRIECIRNSRGFEMRTVSLLTRQLNDRQQPARIRAKVSNMTPNKAGFCGFLIGAGSNELDYRSAALIQRASGKNGGFMAVINEQGELSFKDFTNIQKPLSFERVIRTNTINIGNLQGKEIILDCHIDPVTNGKFDVRLIAIDAKTNKELGFIVRTAVPSSELVGGIMLLSSTPPKQAGARWSFRDISTGGNKISRNDDQGLGPVVGCMHSVNRQILKLSCQFMPIAENEYQTIKLQYKNVNGDEWQSVLAGVDPGFVYQFRVDNWDSTQDYHYRVVSLADEKILYQGKVLKDPNKGKDLTVALYSCLVATNLSLDIEHYKKRLKQENILGRFSNENILFPHTELVSNCDKHQPDMYVFCGDQYYEATPTQIWRNRPDSHLDMLYRWYLWYWTFRDSIRNKPAILLADDHDVLQGNLWGVGGRDPVVLEGDKPTEEDGGYTQTKALVKMVYGMQHGHNPDAYDPTPIAHDIPVTYGAFVYGGVSFALVEDRKFKSRRNIKVNPLYTQGELLGHRQEQFLSAWADMDKGLPKICIASSMWGSPQTKSNLEPLLDYDSNGYPPDGRTRAIKLIKEADAVVICGDQHLAMVAKQGLDDYEDGPTFFAGPAGAAFWQRWFEGLGKLDNQFNQDPNTGNFTDTFGNKMRVLAVANPKVTYDDFKHQTNHSWSNFLSDRRLKSEGYGIVKIQHNQQQIKFECWEWNVDPSTGKQFSGWPYIHKLT
ncbi:alkaline phosphatase D family protein [Shewanella sp. 1_MG-2023]|uniref:alkaline phosphatase D family protein n=1 Tax=unclassified Shewanella TaxID=196818 RepID=UPI0026E2CF6E|nr:MULTISPECIES: alkaline phosphatase D family protein [unclassified Shewanella]MDO6612289.1 alkaline phosphatase D family protein [Shewanella sp. 7_MG-2023]MDO6772143.1 alkaline phosphatase D family protein [Shewanella sp. 2_MG-2023]MDO6794049.1 alkaline phosphatase D family protein [Shewanella sp. 1_MG-2023]